MLRNKFDDCSGLFDLFKYGPVEYDGGGDGGDNEPSSGKDRETDFENLNDSSVDLDR